MIPNPVRSATPEAVPAPSEGRWVTPVEAHDALSALERLDALLDIELKVLKSGQIELLDDLTREKKSLMAPLTPPPSPDPAVGTLQLKMLVAEHRLLMQVRDKLRRNTRMLEARRLAALQRFRIGAEALSRESRARQKAGGAAIRLIDGEA
ncbi:hypothetical protein SAMN06265365_10732 [Tistlia consotensis]|uniref:FlgN protein n=1 Tax=Tistlia consotensis USBA 355 TaxID=560819 RepID=A0A1Y6B8E9_9PROT|nr:hypothetical protein [Tistlia consotensis]SME96909.1 hypothetical protein SAMN05428998_10232 [Tistlia consotensis USBA 355]SNR56303.1 hypothetical protein SAMN06265365_10732 [Tistlia consotensis]